MDASKFGASFSFLWSSFLIGLGTSSLKLSHFDFLSWTSLPTKVFDGFQSIFGSALLHVTDDLDLHRLALANSGVSSRFTSWKGKNSHGSMHQNRQSTFFLFRSGALVGLTPSVT